MGKQKQSGFTIIELLIATTVFAVIMVISLYGFLRITKYYTKGINIARTQDATRNTVDDISRQLQLDAGQYEQVSVGGYTYVCIGNKRYAAKINSAQATGNDILYSDEFTGSCAAGVGVNKKVLVSKDTRVLKFSVEENPIYIGRGLYEISLILMHAPVDVVVDGTDIIDTSAGPTAYDQWRCKSGVAGSEFCSLTIINTSIYRRIGV